MFMNHERLSWCKECIWNLMCTQRIVCTIDFRFDIHDNFDGWVCKFCNEQMMTLTMATMTANQAHHPIRLHSIWFATKVEKNAFITYKLEIQRMRFHLVALNIHDASFTTALPHCVAKVGKKKKRKEMRNVTKLCTYTLVHIQIHNNGTCCYKIQIHTSLFVILCVIAKLRNRFSHFGSTRAGNVVCCCGSC